MKLFLPTSVVWPDFSGLIQKKQDLAELNSGDYLFVRDYEGTTAMRMDEIRAHNYDMTVLYSTGFIEPIGLPRPRVLVNSDRLIDTKGKYYFSLWDFRALAHGIYVIKNSDSGYSDIKLIFNQERPQFGLGQHKSKLVKRISIKTWPKDEPIFITDGAGRQRVLFLQEFDSVRNYRRVLEFFRNGVTNRISKSFYYTSFLSSIEINQCLRFKDKPLDKISEGGINISKIRVYA